MSSLYPWSRAKAEDSQLKGSGTIDTQVLHTNWNLGRRNKGHKNNYLTLNV